MTDECGRRPTVLAAFASPLVLLIVVVLGFPLIVSILAMGIRRTNAFQYSFAAAASITAVFTLTGTVQFAQHWTVLGILAVFAAICAHLWQFRASRVDLVVLATIYLTPVGVGVALLFQTLGIGLGLGFG